MRSKPARWTLYGALVALFLLHNDFWLWHDSRFVLGLPIDLVYHIAYTVVVSMLMFLIIRFAWHYLGERGSPGP